MERAKVYNKCWDYEEDRKEGEVKVYTKKEIEKYIKEKKNAGVSS